MFKFRLKIKSLNLEFSTMQHKIRQRKYYFERFNMHSLIFLKISSSIYTHATKKKLGLKENCTHRQRIQATIFT